MQYSGEFAIVLEDNKVDAELTKQNAKLTYGVIRKFFQNDVLFFLMAVDNCYFIKLGLFLVKKHNQKKHAITHLY